MRTVRHIRRRRSALEARRIAGGGDPPPPIDPPPTPGPPPTFVEPLPSAPTWVTLTQLAAPGASCKVMVTGGYGDWSGSGLAVGAASWQEQHKINAGAYSALADIKVGDDLTLSLSAADVVTVRLYGKNVTGTSVAFIESSPLTIAAAGATLYVLPTAAGSANGSNFANAMGIASVNTAILNAGAQGKVYLGTDAGAYGGGLLILSSGGTAGHPVTIEGRSAGGSTFPDASTTGYSGALVASGSITTSADGQTISLKLITGGITVNHNNVTISDCKILQGGGFGFGINVSAGKTGCIIEDTEIDGQGGYTGIITRGPGTIIRRCNLHDLENCIVPATSGVLIQNNYMHNFSNDGSNPDPHYDGVEILEPVPGLQITGNTIHMPGETAAVNIAALFGSLDNILVDGNYMTDGSNTVIVDDQFNPAYNITNVTISNNFIKPGYAGPYLFRGGQANVGVTLTNDTIISAFLTGGAEASATIIGAGTRTPFVLPPDPETGTDVSAYVLGNEFIRLNAGASHLRFKGMSVSNFGTVFMTNAALSGLLFDDIDMANVLRGWDNNGTTSVTGWTARNVDVVGFARAVARIQNASSKVNFINVTGNSGRQYGANFAVGLQIEDTASKCVFVNTSMSNTDDRRVSTDYWNGDGYSTENQNIEIAWIDCSGAGNTDSGWDLKGARQWLVRPVATDNKRNYRLWGSSGDFITMIDPISLNPHKRGGTGGGAHLWFGNDADVMLVRSTMTDADASLSVYLMDGVTIDGGIIRLVDAPTITTAGTLNAWVAPNIVFRVQDPNGVVGPVTDTLVETNHNEKVLFSYQITATPAFIVKKQAGKDATLYVLTRAGLLTLNGKLFEFDISAGGINRYDVDLILYDEMRRQTAVTVQTQIVNVDFDPVPLILMVRPVAHGDGSGLDWANAGSGSSINAMMARVGPGGIVWVRADEGNYGALNVTLSNGGTAGNRIVVMGVDVAGNPMKANFFSTRPAWTAPATFTPILMNSSSGGTVFNIAVSHVELQHFRFERVEKAFSIAADGLTDIVLGNMQAYNIRHGFYFNTPAWFGTAFHFHDWDWMGFSKDCIRLRGQIDDVLIERVVADSRWQTGDSYATGVRTGSGSAATNVIIRNSLFCNGYEDEGVGNFAQSEGINNERGDSDWRIEDTESFGFSDAGADMKGDRLYFLRPNFHDNRRNWRLWGVGNVIKDATGGRVKKWVPNDSGSRGMIWMGQQGDLTLDGPELQIIGGTFDGGAVIPGDPLNTALAPFIIFELENQILRESGTVTKLNLSASTGSANHTIIMNALSDPAPTITTVAAQNIYKNVRNYIDLTADQGVIWSEVLDPDGAGAVTLNGFEMARGNKLRILSQPLVVGGDNTRAITVQASNANKTTTDLVITATVLDQLPPWTYEDDMEGVNGLTSWTSTSGHTVTAINGAALTTTTALRGTSSALFDGSDDVASPNVAVGNLLFGGSAFTIGCVFRPTVLDASLRHMISFWRSSSGRRSWALGVIGTEVAFTYSIDGNTATTITSVGAGLAINTTYTAICDRADDNVFRIYVVADGGSGVAPMKVKSSITGTLRTPSPADTGLTLGRQSASGSNLFGGRLDAVRIMKGAAPFASDSGVTLADFFFSVALPSEESLWTSAGFTTVEAATGVSLGTVFHTSVNSSLEAVRFFRANPSVAATFTSDIIDQGTLPTSYTAAIYGAGGSPLATKVVTGQTTLGWITITLDTPVALTGGTSYTVVVFAAASLSSVYYPALAGAFDSSILSATARIVGTLGVAAYGAALAKPTLSIGNTAYFIDPVVAF